MFPRPMETFHLRIVTGLFMCTVACGLPLPRIMYQQVANPVKYWEVRPASEEYRTTTAEFNPGLYASYLGGRLDPDRPYIQMIVPSTDEIADAEKKPGGPFGPTRPTLGVDRNKDEDDNMEEKEIGNCVNGSINGTSGNGTHFINGTNTTECYDKTQKAVPTQALVMLADGTTIYSVDEKKGTGKENSSPDGAYELAYVAHRPYTANSPRPEAYPLIQYANYNGLPWDGFGRLSGPLYPAVGLYQPVYIYRPVFPSPSRSYDVYYYLPSDHDDKTAAELNEKRKPANAESAVEGSETKDNAIVENTKHATVMSSKNSEAKEIAMPNAGEETEYEEQALVDALDSKMAELQEQSLADLQETEVDKTTEIQTEGEEDQDELNAQWDEELDNINDKDLIDAVERVLQQLHSRLIN